MTLDVKKKPLDFSVIREEWTVAELSDGSIIKTRMVLLFVAPSRDPAVGRYEMRVQQEHATWAAEKGEPGEVPAIEVLKTNIMEANIAFRYLSEGESLYSVEDGQTVRLKPLFVRFDKTRFHDSYGEPVFLVESQTQLELSGMPPPQQR